MISREEIEHLATLSRLKLNDAEIASLEKEFSAILDYVGHIQEATAQPEAALVRNVMREDTVSGTPESSREELLAAAPAREGDYIVVRKILAKDEA